MHHKATDTIKKHEHMSGGVDFASCWNIPFERQLQKQQQQSLYHKNSSTFVTNDVIAAKRSTTDGLPITRESDYNVNNNSMNNISAGDADAACIF